MAKREVDIKVKYIPDTSALKSALSGAQKIDFKIGGSGLKKELLTPVQNAMREVNKAIASGADNKTLLKLFQDVGKAADSAKLKATGMLTEINSGFNSAGNQKLLTDLEKYQKELDKVEKKISNWENKYGNKAMSQMKMDLGVGGISDAKKQTAELEEQVKLGKTLTQQELDRLDALKKYINTWNERKELADKGITRGGMESEASVLRSKISDIMTTVELPKTNVEWTKQLTPIINALGQAAGLSAQEINRLTTAIGQEDKAAKDAVNENKKEVLKLADVVTGTFLGTSVSSMFESALHRGIEFFKEYDETLTRTMMVTGMTREEVNSLTSSYNELANQLSSTTKDVAAAQLVFYQQGLGTSEALAMTEASIAISKTGGIEAGEAANRLTAAIRGYQLAATDAMDIADKMSALDAAAASSVDELTVAMQKSASQARMAGLDLDYYMAYLSTMQEVTREAPENIGTAMKSITSRMQEIRDIGKIEEDGTTFSNVAKALTSIGIAATDSSGQLRSLQDIMNELGPMWATLDRNHKAYIATTLAGNRQQSRFIALMDNYDRAMELVNVSQNASGESAKQLRAYNQGLEASFTALSNAWQQFATKVADSDMIKGVIDLLTDFVEILNKIPKPITQTIIPLTALIKGFQLFKSAGSLFGEFKGAIGKNLGIDTFIKQTDGLSKSLNSSMSIISKWGNTLARAFNGIGNNTSNLSKVSEYTDAYTNSLIRNSASMTAATAASVQNNAANLSELGETQQVTASEMLLAAAYDEGTEAIKLNKAAMDDNSYAYALEQDEQMKTADSIMRDARGRLEVLENTQYKQMDREIAERNATYDRGKSEKASARLEAKARKRLKDAGDINPSRAALVEEMDRVALEIDKKVDEDIQAIADRYKKLDEDLQAQIAATKDEIEEMADIIRQRRAEISKDGTIKVKKGTKIPGVNAPEDSNKLVSDSKTTNFQHIKETFSNQNIGNIIKAKTAIGELGKTINMASISSGIMIGSMVNMGAQTLGIDEDISGALGTFTGLGKILSGFGLWGWAAAAGIAGLQLTFKKLYPSVEDVKEELTELATEGDSIKQTQGDIQAALDSYKELSNQLNRTEEEQEQLNNAIDTLSKEVPGVVQGYDSMGNAIIDLTAVTEKLNKVQEELIANSEKTLATFTKLQKAEGTNWKTIGADILSVVEYIGNPLAKLAEDIIGVDFTLSGVLQNTLENEKIEANKKVWEENFSEIYSNLQTLVADVIDKGSEENAQLRQKFSDSLISIFSTRGMQQGLEIEEVQKQIEELYSKFNVNTLDMVVDLSDSMALYADISNASWGELKEQVIKQLKSRTAYLDLTDEEFNALVKVTLNASWDIGVDIDAVQEELRTALLNSSDSNRQLDIQYFSDSLDLMDKEMVKTLDDLNLLNVGFVELFDLLGGNVGLDEKFRDESGEIDKTLASITLLNEAYKERNRQQAELEANEIKRKEKLENRRKELIEEAENLSGGFLGIGDNTNGFSYDEEYGALALSESGLQKMFGTRTGTDIAEEINEIDEELKEIEGSLEEDSNQLSEIDNIIENIIANFATAEAPSFSTLSEEISNISSQFQEVFDLAESLDNSMGKMSLDNISSMFGIIGQFEADAMSNAQSWDLWNNSIEKINNGLSVQNGQLVAETSVMEGLNQLVAEQAKMKMAEHLATIDANAAELQYQNDILNTQLTAVRAAIKRLEANGTTSEAESDMYNALDALDTQFNAERVAREIKANNTILTYTADFASKYSKIIAAAKDGKYTGEFELTEVDFDNIITELKGDLQTELDKYIVDGDVTASLNNLYDLEKQLQGQIDNNNKTINNTLDLKRKITAYLSDENTNLAGVAKGYDDASDSASDYNEKLERTLTLLEKIEGLQHTIDENETFKSLYEGYDGEAYGRLLVSNLNLAQQQYEVYKDLFAMQQEMTNQAAGDLLDSPYGQMFKIMENGDIGWADASMYDKYKNLPDDMQEDIDNLVEAFQKQRDALRDTEQDLSKYAQEVRKVREELVAMEIEIENELVEAIKNREKILHDARMKALDDEVAMIEEAVEKRQKAREDEAANKELYQAQEALRRATLDSSGKNNASLLQLQQELEEKQLEISEKRFEDDMEDRKNWLQDTKDAETETYEYRLETMTWYWEEVQAIQEAGTEAMMQTLITWNEQYRTTSDLQQREMKREWQETMDAMKAAADMGAELGKLTSDIVSVTHSIEDMNIKIAALPGTWQKATDSANAYAAAVSKIPSYSGSTGGSIGGGVTTTVSNGNSDAKNPKKELDRAYMKWVGKTVEIKGSGNIATYKDLSGKAIYESNPWGINPNVQVSDIQKKGKDYYAFVNWKGGRWIAIDQLQTTDLFGKALSKYKTGGMVDYTGPAWVDGTKSHPEAFLSAYQTEQIGALAGALDSNTVNNVSGDSNISFGSINFNVASMSSAADGRKALDIFVQGANDLMAKKGVNTKINLNIK